MDDKERFGYMYLLLFSFELGSPSREKLDEFVCEREREMQGRENRERWNMPLFLRCF